jgi:hypothetical protein
MTLDESCHRSFLLTITKFAYMLTDDFYCVIVFLFLPERRSQWSLHAASSE